MDLGLTGKVVMVTGGAGRIGPVICATFAREGARCRAVGRQMVARGACGAIVNLSSGAATSARLGAAGYSGSKAAIDMLTQALAIELGPHGIRVNAVAPGLVTDAALRADDPGLSPYMRMMLDMTPLGRTGAPADIAEVVAFMASERNAWMTGTIVEVSGGSHTGRPHVPLPRPPAS